MCAILLTTRHRCRNAIWLGDGDIDVRIMRGIDQVGDLDLIFERSRELVEDL
jgi:hypothetical protein